MSDHQEAEVDNNDESVQDSRVDAFAAVILILLAVVACVFIVSNL